MPTNQTIKYIHSLRQKKYRDIHKQFVAEGVKIVSALMNGYFHIDRIYATSEWMESHSDAAQEYNAIPVKQNELKKLSSLKTPNQVLAVADFPGNPAKEHLSEETHIIALDNIQDPGNMGTIIRIADWFGIRHIICSETTVDCYNPKVVQATMGSIGNVRTIYTDLATFLDQHPDRKIYGACLQGISLYEETFDEKGIIVFGNESAGISETIAERLDQQIYIPHFPPYERKADSLNVSVSVGIICSEIRRGAHEFFLE